MHSSLRYGCPSWRSGRRTEQSKREEIAQARGLERRDVIRRPGHQEASENRHLACDRSGVDTRHMAPRQVALGLLRQRADAVPQDADADADVVKIVVHEER